MKLLLIAARWLHDQVGSVEGLPEHTKKKVDFFTRQYIDALAPSNFALTNPEVFRETIATGGQNLVKGLHNLLDDIDRGNAQLADIPPQFRDVVVLVDIGDFSYADAAQILDVPIGTVMSRLHRGRRALKQHIAEGALS